MVKPTLEVVLTPALLPLYDIKGKTVVVIDILRATTSMCVAFHTGVKKILPVSTPEECRIFKDFDFLCAAERNAAKLDGFDLGNSPFEYQNPILKDRNIAFTTTNGTKAIRLSREMGAGQITVGAFLNLSFLCHWLIQQQAPIVLLCAGWKDKVNLEDTLFAGAVIEQLRPHVEMDCDSALMAENLYLSSKTNLEEVVRQSSHAKRFRSLHTAEDDVKFCVQIDTLQILPILKDEYLVLG
jgi:2-phosphosulfolactate phosphatase